MYVYSQHTTLLDYAALSIMLAHQAFDIILTGVNCLPTLMPPSVPTLSPLGQFSPALLLELFVQELGEALHTVTSLALNLHNTGCSTVTASRLCKALSLLMSASPALTALSLEGQFSPLLLRMVHQACPLLSELSLITEHEDENKDERDAQAAVQLSDLTLITKDTDGLDMQAVVHLLPSLLPNVHTLSLPQFIRSLPDMSKNVGITTLCVKSLVIDSEAIWLCLPSKLQHLQCSTVLMRLDPVRRGVDNPNRSEPFLGSLLTFNFRIACFLLKPLAKILVAAPALQAFHLHPKGDNTQ